MTRRRTLLLGGAALAGAAVVGGGISVAGRWDDIARELGLEPVATPAASDTEILREAAADQARLIAVVGPHSATITMLLTEQLQALGGSEDPVTDSPATDLNAARAELLVSSQQRTDHYRRATSAALAQMLGSIAASLSVMGSGAIT